MKPIRKKLVMDEDHRPVAVQIDYEDWLEIEQRLGLKAPEAATQDQPTLEEMAAAVRPHWTGGDGLDYQRRIREEWTRPWDPDAQPGA